MAKTFIDRLLEGCDGETNEYIYNKIVDAQQTIEYQTRGSSSSFEHYLKTGTAKKLYISDRIKKVQPVIEKKLKDINFPFLNDKEFDTAMQELTKQLQFTDDKEYNLELVFENVNNLLKYSNFFENYFIYCLAHVSSYQNTYKFDIQIPDEYITPLEENTPTSEQMKFYLKKGLETKQEAIKNLKDFANNDIDYELKEQIRLLNKDIEKTNEIAKLFATPEDTFER